MGQFQAFLDNSSALDPLISGVRAHYVDDICLNVDKGQTATALLLSGANWNMHIIPILQPLDAHQLSGSIQGADYNTQSLPVHGPSHLQDCLFSYAPL